MRSLGNRRNGRGGMSKKRLAAGSKSESNQVRDCRSVSERRACGGKIAPCESLAGEGEMLKVALRPQCAFPMRIWLKVAFVEPSMAVFESFSLSKIGFAKYCVPESKMRTVSPGFRSARARSNPSSNVFASPCAPTVTAISAAQTGAMHKRKAASHFAFILK